MVSVQIKVTKNGLKGATGKTRAALAKALADEKGWVLAGIQQKTPVDTGELVGSETATSDANSIKVKADAPHAIYVHQGTRYMAARPFAKDGAEEAAPRVAETVGQRIVESLA